MMEYTISMDSSPTRADIVESSHAPKRMLLTTVPQHCLTDENRHVFESNVISIGPYHFSRPTLSRTEKFKADMLNKFVAESRDADPTKDKAFFFKEILERITEIRSNYADAFFNHSESSNDEMFALAILNDISLVVGVMKDDQVMDPNFNHLGLSTLVYMFRDLLKLENQIPFWVMKRVMDLRFGKDEADEILRKFLSQACFLDENLLTKLPWDDTEEQQPLHLLEAYRTTFLKGEVATKAESNTLPRFLTKFKHRKVWKPGYISSSQNNNLINTLNSPFRCVTYLKAKGIYCRPSSHSLRDITFTSNPCYGVLHLPIWFVNSNTNVFFSNMVAFEMSPGFLLDFDIMYYVNFMKSLIESEKDVKELRERGILFTNLGADEEIVKAFKGIDTHGIDDFGIFVNVKQGIDEHCNKKAKTWISDLVHSYFHSPWTAIGLFAAMLILCLTLIQTYFTINPRSRS